MRDVPVQEVVWNLEDLYEGPGDPRRETDRQWCRDEADGLADAYRGKIAHLSAPELLEAIQRFERFEEMVRHLTTYAQLYFSTRTEDPKAGALWQEAVQLESEIHRDTLFFELEWKQMDEQKAEELMDDPVLENYGHFLRVIRRYRPYTLSEPEEKVLAETSPMRATAWSTLFDKVVTHLRFGKQQRTQSEVLSELYHADRDVRKQAALDVTQGLETVLHIQSHTFNTILQERAVSDRMRGYPHWLSARNLSNEAEDGMVEALVAAVTSRYDIVQRYYRLKRSLLGYEEICDYDRYAPIPGLGDSDYSWSEAREMVLGAYKEFSPLMADIAREFFDEKWIHAPVLPGKRGGAFAHPATPDLHPFILLNFTGKLRDVTTLAHELGHGIHQYLARQQGLFNGQTPLTMAETASVFGELLVFRKLLARLEKPENRLALICSRLEDDFATIFRQVAMNRFEDMAHNERRSKGELAPQRLSEIWMQTQKNMFGDSVTLLDQYSIWWSYIPHFVHAPGYVYAYAFGNLLVLALAGMYDENPESFVPRYLELLSSGGNAGPEELLEPFGVNLNDPDFWSRGLGMLEDFLKEAEALTA